MIEQLWRSVKCEEVYLKENENYQDCRDGLEAYFEFYNEKRHHQSLKYRTPQEVYRDRN